MKFWAAILTNRLHIFALGQHENEEQAYAFSEAFVDRKTEENRRIMETRQNNDAPDGADRPPLPSYQLVCVMDDEDLRRLTGEVHRPYVVARQRREVAVEVPRRQCDCAACDLVGEHTEGEAGTDAGAVDHPAGTFPGHTE